MIANHAVPVVADAWLKGIRTPYFTDNEIFNALWTTVTKMHHGNHIDLINRYGYIPYDDKMTAVDNGRETVSKLLEGIYDDYCVAQMAKSLNKWKEYVFLMNRAGYYRNVYDAGSGFMRGKNKKVNSRRMSMWMKLLESGFRNLILRKRMPIIIVFMCNMTFQGLWN